MPYSQLHGILKLWCLEGTQLLIIAGCQCTWIWLMLNDNTICTIGGISIWESHCHPNKTKLVSLPCKHQAIQHDAFSCSVFFSQGSFSFFKTPCPSLLRIVTISVHSECENIILGSFYMSTVYEILNNRQDFPCNVSETGICSFFAYLGVWEDTIQAIILKRNEMDISLMSHINRLWVLYGDIPTWRTWMMGQPRVWTPYLLLPKWALYQLS